MAIEKMNLLEMTFDKDDLYSVLFCLKEAKYFYPQAASKIINGAQNVNTLDEDVKYAHLLERLTQIAVDLQFDLNHNFAYQRSLNIDKTDTYLGDLEESIKQIKLIQEQLENEKDENEKTLQILKHISSTNIHLDQLQQCQYVTARFGRIEKHKLSLNDRLSYIFEKLGEDDRYIWCCYMATNSDILEVDNLFCALGFEIIQLPSFVHGTIDEAKNELKEEIEAMKEYIQRMEQKIAILREENKIDLLKLYSTISFLYRIEEFKVFVVDYRQRYAIYGFISQKCMKDFQSRFQSLENINFQMLPADMLVNQHVEMPAITNNLRCVKPFEMMVHFKSFQKWDPTIAFAILYYAVFILFFGDLGVGVVLALLGLIMRKKKMGKLLLSLSIATILGGFIYVQAFYTINFYPALTLPLSPFMRVIDGVILLIVGTLTIRTAVSMSGNQSLIDCIYSIKGVCGLMMMYVFIIYLGCLYEMHIALPMILLEIIIVMCLILVLTKSFVKKRLIR